MSGFIALHREAFSHPLLKDGDRFRAWFWLVSMAAWKPTRIDVSGEMIALDRGQMCFSIRYLADAWGWPKSNVDRFLKRLVAEEMLFLTRSKTGTGNGTRTGTGQLILTIRNYSKYQDVSEATGTGDGTPTGTEVGQQRDKEEQGNKETNIPSPYGDGRDASPPQTAADITKAIFDTGIVILKAAGHEDRPARSMIGRWRKTFTDSLVLTVLARCEAERPSHPIEWITKALQAEQRKVSGNGPTDFGNAPGAARRGQPDGTTSALHRQLAEARSREAAEAAQRRDDSPAGSDGELPFAAAPALPGS